MPQARREDRRKTSYPPLRTASNRFRRLSAYSKKKGAQQIVGLLHPVGPRRAAAGDERKLAAGHEALDELRIAESGPDLGGLVVLVDRAHGAVRGALAALDAGGLGKSLRDFHFLIKHIFHPPRDIATCTRNHDNIIIGSLEEGI